MSAFLHSGDSVLLLVPVYAVFIAAVLASSLDHAEPEEESP